MISVDTKTVPYWQSTLQINSEMSESSLSSSPKADITNPKTLSPAIRRHSRVEDLSITSRQPKITSGPKDDRLAEFKIGNVSPIHVPFEVFVQIFSFLSAATLSACSHVCYTLNKWAKDERLWKALFIKDFNSDPFLPPQTSWKETYCKWSLHVKIFKKNPVCIDLRSHQSSIMSLYPRTNELFIADENGEINVWDLTPKPRAKKRLKVSKNPIYRFQVDSRFLYIAEAKEFKIIDLQKLESVKSLNDVNLQEYWRFCVTTNFIFFRYLNNKIKRVNHDFKEEKVFNNELPSTFCLQALCVQANKQLLCSLSAPDLTCISNDPHFPQSREVSIQIWNYEGICLHQITQWELTPITPPGFLNRFLVEEGLIVCALGRKIYMWDIETRTTSSLSFGNENTMIYNLQIHKNLIFCFGSNGIADSNENRKGSIKIINKNDGTCLNEIPTSFIRTFKFHDDTLFACSKTEIKMWKF